MTNEDAQVVAKIMLTADSWCGCCQRGLIEQLKTAFPEHAAVVDHIRQRASEIEAAFNSAKEACDGDITCEDKIHVWSIRTPRGT